MDQARMPIRRRALAVPSRAAKQIPVMSMCSGTVVAPLQEESALTDSSIRRLLGIPDSNLPGNALMGSHELLKYLGSIGKMNPLGEADVLAPGIGGGEGRCFAQLAL